LKLSDLGHLIPLSVLKMRWLIVEDALRDRKGHWFEYVETFARELRALGDQVTVLADRAAEPFSSNNCRCSSSSPLPSGIAWATAQVRYDAICACRFTPRERISQLNKIFAA
jgi:hypothetical protein